MYSLKHVDDDKKEMVVAAVSVGFDPIKKEVTGHGSSGSEDGIIRFTTGRVYVMNERGSTVGVYILSM